MEPRDTDEFSLLQCSSIHLSSNSKGVEGACPQRPRKDGWGLQGFFDPGDGGFSEVK